MVLNLFCPLVQLLFWRFQPAPLNFLQQFNRALERGGGALFCSHRSRPAFKVS
jgi:hypothetical protein